MLHGPGAGIEYHHGATSREYQIVQTSLNSSTSMLRWPVQATRLSLGLRKCLPSSLRYHRVCQQQRFATTSPEAKRAWLAETFPILDHLGFPPEHQYRKGDPISWMRHIEQALPFHLRHHSSKAENQACLDPTETAGILLAAHKLAKLNEHPDTTSLLTYLGVVEQRWDAVIWLIKHVIEGTEAVLLPRPSPSIPIWPWTNEGSMHSITDNAFTISVPALASGLPDLETLTSSQRSDEVKLAKLNEHPDTTSLLTYLGVVEQRWDAVIWLIKHVIEGTEAVLLPRPSPSIPIWPWTNEGSMHSITDNAFTISVPALASGLPDLETLTSSQRSDEAPTQATIRRDFLGLLWYSLAEMILVCEDGVIKPEVLEIIAYLHHRELMPMSIYAQKPPATAHAIQQPPLLHLLSSQILKSLSDAAWKAQERLIMKEAEARGSYYRAIPPTAYRVHVEGLRPEVWLELVLWSCLQGDWLCDGLLILYRICVHQGRWAPLPWRALIPNEQGSHVMVNRFLEMYPNAGTDRMDQSYAQVRRTISSEVVNAYIDALLSEIPEVEPHGDTLVTMHGPRLLASFKMFMERSHTGLHAGSWDTVVLRGYNSTNNSLASSALPSPTALADLSKLSPRLSQLVEDESFMAVGLYHNALRQTVEQGNLEGSIQLIKQLNTYTMTSKTTNKSSPSEEMESQYSSQFQISSGRTYTKPPIHANVPTTILAPLLELVLDSQAYKVGRALLDQGSPSTFVIKGEMYGDPVLSASLARFAAETGDRALFSRIISETAMHKQRQGPQAAQLSENLSRAFLNTQINVRKWSAARKLLEFMKDLKYSVDTDTLANLSGVILKAQANRKEGDLEQGKELFTMVLSNRDDQTYHDANNSRLHIKSQVKVAAREERNRQTLLLAIIASLDPYWAVFCTGVRELSGFRTFTLSARTFNIVFEGIIEAFGSSVGRRVLEQFWPYRIRNLQSKLARDTTTTIAKRTYSVNEARRSLVRTRTVVRLPGHPDHKVVIYGGLDPNVMTFDLLFRKLLKEMSSRPKSAGSIPHAAVEDVATSDGIEDLSQPGSEIRNSAAVNLVWVVRCLQRMHSCDDRIRRELSAAFKAADMQDVRKLLPNLYNISHDDDHSDIASAS
nr:hypothetical protein CFP56_10204 [Quercus suber]